MEPVLHATTVIELLDEAFRRIRRLEDRARDERPRDERPRDERPRDDRPRDDRPHDELVDVFVALLRDVPRPLPTTDALVALLVETFLNLKENECCGFSPSVGSSSSQ